MQGQNSQTICDLLEKSRQQQMQGPLLCASVHVNIGILGTLGERNRTRSSGSPHILCTLSYYPSLLQLGLDTYQTQSSTSTGDPGRPSDLGAGPSGLGVREVHHLGGDNLCLPSPEPPPGAVGTGQTGQREYIKPDPLEQEPTEYNPGAIIQIPNLQTTQGFVNVLRVASLEKSGMQPEDITSLRDLAPVLDLEDPSPLLRSLRHFINNSGSSWAHYNGIQEIKLLNNPSDAFMSFDQVKWCLLWLSSIVPLEHDMCPNTCVAYTGPYKELDTCPHCPLSRYFPNTNMPWKRFTTLPIGPVIQAFYRSRKLAEHMHYLERALTANADHAQRAGGSLDKYDDISCGNDILSAWTSGALRKSDVALQLSIDSAQLRADQPSEAWVFIWIFHNLPPNLRYKKCFIIPGAIIPGPNKPGDIDSFLFPSLYHVASLQHKRLWIYDALVDSYIPHSKPLIVFATADSLGSAAMSGMVGHSEKYGCHLYCNMPSWHHTGNGHYYPAMLTPHNYTVLGCDHSDVLDNNLAAYRNHLNQKYQQNLDHLLTANTQTEFRIWHLEVGLCKQTLFSSLPYQPLPVLNIFTMDIMHLTVLNDPDVAVMPPRYD